MCYEESNDEKRREGDDPARSPPSGALDKGTYPLTDCSEVHDSSERLAESDWSESGELIEP
jgi:hypothetical protein